MTLRVLSYNILAGGEGRLSQITRVIQSQRPDVVALLEARSRPHVEVLARALQIDGRSELVALPGSAGHHYVSGDRT